MYERYIIYQNVVHRNIHTSPFYIFYLPLQIDFSAGIILKV